MCVQKFWKFSRNFLRLVGPAVAAVVGEWRRSGNADRGDERGASHRFGNDQAAWRGGLEDRWRLQLTVNRVNAAAAVKLDVAAAVLDKDGPTMLYAALGVHLWAQAEFPKALARRSSAR